MKVRYARSPLLASFVLTDERDRQCEDQDFVVLSALLAAERPIGQLYAARTPRAVVARAIAKAFREDL
jgi:hypothetical protein